MQPEENKPSIGLRYATGGQRKEKGHNPLDDFPTPPWATRALLEKVLLFQPGMDKYTCWEPACNRGAMSKVLEEYFREVWSTDVEDYGFGSKHDFLNRDGIGGSHKPDWIITNPPFAMAEAFIQEANVWARKGVAMLVRTQFLEGKGRYERLFAVNPPTAIAQFSERVPMFQGRLDGKGSTATAYCWLIWDKRFGHEPTSFSIFLQSTVMVWIPPCRKELERPNDYSL